MSANKIIQYNAAHKSTLSKFSKSQVCRGKHFNQRILANFRKKSC